MINALLRNSKLLNVPKTSVFIDRRCFFRWLDVIFNRVSRRRVKKYGADRVCSEWLLRNGASVRWKGTSDYLTNYNNLPNENVSLYIQAVDATESDIHDIGFHHFDGCKYIDEVKLVGCKKVSDRGLPLLSYLKDSLLHLEIRDCKAITHASLHKLSDLQNLKTLTIAQLPYVEKKEDVVTHLKKSLPNCEINYE